MAPNPNECQPTVAERNLHRAYNKEKTLTDKHLNPTGDISPNLRLAQKHLEAARKQWHKLDGMANSAINGINDETDYNAAVAAWKTTADAAVEWLQTSEHDLETQIKQRADNRAQTITTQE